MEGDSELFHRPTPSLQLHYTTIDLHQPHIAKDFGEDLCPASIKIDRYQHMTRL